MIKPDALFNNKHQKGNIIPIVFLLIISIIALAVLAYTRLSSSNPDADLEAEPVIISFEDCIRAGHGPPVVVPEMNTFVCHGPNRGFYLARFEACIISNCPELREAFVKFCNNEYISMINGQGEYLTAYASPAKVKNNFARGSIRCYKESEPDWFLKDPLHVFMGNNAGKWELQLVSSKFTCDEFDNTGIPAAIVGPCYDTEVSGFRAPE